MLEEVKNWSSLKKAVYAVLPLLIYAVIHDGAEILLWACVEFLMSMNGGSLQAFLMQHAYTVSGIVGGLAMLAGGAAVWKMLIQELSFRRVTGTGLSGKEKKPEEEKRGWSPEPKVTGYMVLAALAFLVAVSVNILFYQLGFTQSSETYQEVHQMQYGVQFAVGLILYGIISPAAEEIVFRGVIHNRMRRCFSVRIALVMSALLFGLYHGNLVQAVYGTILGLVIAYVYELYDDFAAPVIFHSVANISVYAMTYQNDLRNMNRTAALFVAAIMVMAAVGVLIYMRKKCGSGSKQSE